MTPIEARAQRARIALIHLAYKQRDAHLSSSLSIIDGLTAAYEALEITPPGEAGSDFILSKGHGAAGWYTVLAEFGILTYSQLSGFNADDGTLPLHSSRHSVAPTAYSAGSLGHGLGFGLGVALAKRLDGHDPSPTVVLLGDGECNEGSVWEAATVAAAQQLGALICLIDANGVQCVAQTRELFRDMDLAARFSAFGWDAHQAQGHDLESLVEIFRIAKDRPLVGAPLCIQLNTIAGYGVPFMEGDIAWHYDSPSEDQYLAAIKTLDPGDRYADVIEALT